MNPETQVDYVHGIDAVLDFIEMTDNQLIIKELRNSSLISGEISCPDGSVYYKIFKNNKNEFLLAYSLNHEMLFKFAKHYGLI